MSLWYNGIRLEIDSIQEFSKVPVFHHNKYLYTRHVLRCRCIYNPRATAYIRPGGPPGAFIEDRDGEGLFEGTQTALVDSTKAAGNEFTVAGFTEATLRHHLLTRGRQLFYLVENLTAGNPPIEMLVSPARTSPLFNPQDEPGLRFYKVDATGGPFPLAANVVKRHGNKTLELDFAVRTDLNECHLFSDCPSPLISHQWTMTREVDRDFYAKRVIKGEAKFRLDRLEQLQARADDYMRWLSHAVPDYCQRAHTAVMPSEDGTTIHYTVVDEEKPMQMVLDDPAANPDLGFTFHNLGVSRVEAKVKSSVTTVGAEGYAGGVIKIGTEFAQTAGGSYGLSAIKAITDFLSLNVGLWLPSVQQVLQVQVWGHRWTTREALLHAATYVLGAAMSSLEQLLCQNAIEMEEDLMGRYIGLSVAISRGPTTTGIRFGSTSLMNLKPLLHSRNPSPLGGVLVPQDELIQDGYPAGTFDLPAIPATPWTPEIPTQKIPYPGSPALTLTRKTPSPQPAPPGDGVVVGTLPGALVSQALLGSCEITSEPSVTPPHVLRTPYDAYGCGKSQLEGDPGEPPGYTPNDDYTIPTDYVPPRGATSAVKWFCVSNGGNPQCIGYTGLAAGQQPPGALRGPFPTKAECEAAGCP